MKEYYILDAQGNQVGPIGEETLRSAYYNGEHKAETLTWSAGMETWKPMVEVFGPAPAPKESVPPPPPLPPAPQMMAPATQPAAQPVVPAPVYQPTPQPVPAVPPPMGTVPPPYVERQFYVTMPDGTRQGPIAEGVLRQALQNGTYPPTLMVWTNGMANWSPLGSVLGNPVWANALEKLSKVNWKKLVDFGTRASRKEFWLTFLIVVAVFVMLRYLGGNSTLRSTRENLWYFADAVFILGLLPVTVRRLNDIGLHFALAVLIFGILTSFEFEHFDSEVIVNIGRGMTVGWIILMCLKGQPFANKHGAPIK